MRRQTVTREEHADQRTWRRIVDCSYLLPVRTNGRIRLAVSFTCLAVTGCERAPSVDVLGSYFPGWLICLVVALPCTVLVRSILRRLQVEVSAPVIVYPSLLALFTFAQWLIFLR